MRNGWGLRPGTRNAEASARLPVCLSAGLRAAWASGHEHHLLEGRVGRRGARRRQRLEQSRLFRRLRLGPLGSSGFSAVGTVGAAVPPVLSTSTVAVEAERKQSYLRAQARVCS